MAEPILIDYNGNQYDLAQLRDTVLNNYNDYARRFGYGRNKFQKDYQGLVEILRQLESGNARVETGRLIFNDTFADDKGAFGKARNKSKHYTNPAWMILDTIQKMDKYDKDKGKKKLSKSVLNQELQSGIGDISSLTPENRLEKQRRIVAKMLAKYSNLGDNYIIEDGFDLPEYLEYLRELQKNLDTAELADDDFSFNMLGLSNANKPEEKKPEQLKGYKAFRQKLLESNAFTEADEDLMKKEWEKALPELRKKAIDAALGITTAEAPAAPATPAAAPQPAAPAAPPSTPSVEDEDKDKEKEKDKTDEKSNNVKYSKSNRSKGESSVVGKVIKKIFAKNGTKLQQIRKFKGGGVEDGSEEDTLDQISGRVASAANSGLNIGTAAMIASSLFPQTRFIGKLYKPARALTRWSLYGSTANNATNAVRNGFEGDWLGAIGDAAKAGTDIYLSRMFSSKRPYVYDQAKIDAASKAKENLATAKGKIRPDITKEELADMKKTLSDDLTASKAQYDEAVKNPSDAANKTIIDNYKSKEAKLKEITDVEAAETAYNTARSDAQMSGRIAPITGKELKRGLVATGASYGLLGNMDNEHYYTDIFSRAFPLMGGYGNWKSLLDTAPPPEPVIPGIVGATLIPGSVDAQNATKQAYMHDLYSAKAGDPVRVDGRTGMLKGFTTKDGTLYGVGPDDSLLSGQLQTASAYGNYPDWLRELNPTTNSEGRTVIPAETMQKIKEDNPELYKKVLDNGIFFGDTSDYDPGSTTVAQNNNFITDYFNRLRGQIANGQVVGGEYTIPAILAAGLAAGIYSAPGAMSALGKGLTDWKATAALGIPGMFVSK